MAGLLARPRFEVLPQRGAEAMVAEHVGREVKITVTAAPSRGLEPTLDLAERLRARGFEAVPHLAARMLRDQARLGDVLARVKAAGLREIFVVGGDSGHPAGPFPDALSLLEAIARLGPQPNSIGIAGHPERHPLMDEAGAARALGSKQHHAGYIVSNLSFDPVSVRRWVARVRAQRVSLPIHVGVAGPVDAGRLLRISARIGAGDSVRFLRGHGGWLRRAFRPGGYSPEGFLSGLLPELGAPDQGVAGVHVFTFNEIEATETWRQALLAELHAPA
ncbi:MAG: methylenetetrahydrofolate reductase [Candidatus Dormibacteraeota bacterium]|nr:methylenetetrahydrofolate reductase [Candidatus Dormibacteraeota bacterium]